MTKWLPVFFHIGEDLALKTKVAKGRVLVDGTSVRISGEGTEIDLSSDRIRSVALVRPHFVGSVIKVDLGSEYLFVAVTRFAIGQFVLVNYLATVRLFDALSAISAGPSVSGYLRRPFSWKRSVIIFAVSALGGVAFMALLSFLKRQWY